MSKQHTGIRHGSTGLGEEHAISNSMTDTYNRPQSSRTTTESVSEHDAEKNPGVETISGVEYTKIGEIRGSPVVVQGVSRVAYDELVEIEISS